MNRPKTYAGFKILDIVLDTVEYRYIWPISGDTSTENDLKDNLEITPEFMIDSNRGYVRLNFLVNAVQDDGGCHCIKGRLIGAYEKTCDDTALPFETFLQLHAPAAMFAFLRELVFSITSRSPATGLFLDPTNILGLFEHQQSNKMQATLFEDTMTENAKSDT